MRDFDPFYESFEMSIGAYGKYSQRFGGSLFGVERTFRIAMDLTNHFELEPFMEFRRSGTWRLSMGINSTPFAGLGLRCRKRIFRPRFIIMLLQTGNFLPKPSLFLMLFILGPIGVNNFSSVCSLLFLV